MAEKIKTNENISDTQIIAIGKKFHFSSEKIKLAIPMLKVDAKESK